MSRKKLRQFYVIKGPNNTQLLNRITYAANIHFQHIFRPCIVLTLISYLLIILKLYINYIWYIIIYYNYLLLINNLMINI
jgi:hypothetical protein